MSKITQLTETNLKTTSDQLTKDQNEHSVERDHPEHMFKKHERAVETQQALPGELLGRPVPLDGVPVQVVCGSSRVEVVVGWSPLVDDLALPTWSEEEVLSH